MSKNSPRFSRLSVLAPAALSACMDASVLAVPAAGAIVSTVLKELSKAFMLKKWFHGSMSAKEAERLMLEQGKNGSYLVRESKAHPGDYVLSVRVRGRVSHVIIKKQNNKYEVGSGEQFDDLVGLIEHFRSYPMTEAAGDVLRLLQPVSGSRLRVADIEDKFEMKDSKEEESKELDSKSGLDGEFLSLQTMESLQEFTTKAALRPENSSKNRYRNVLPYDQTRVVLKGRGEGQDYINASYIRPWLWESASSSVQSSNESLDSVQSLTFKKDPKPVTPLVSKSLSDDALREVKRCMKLDKLNGNIGSFDKISATDKIYIATQGCLSNTKDDFWRMVWQEDVRVIVMITNEVENGKKKCDRYWPLSGQEATYDGLTVKSISETSYEDYLLREMDVESGSCVRTIYQYHYTAWPDHGTPTETEGVLAFIDDVNRRLAQVSQAKNPPEQNVICVHCSAGVGRTGTFIVLDMLIDTVRSYGCRNVDVHAATRLARAQRGGMVQNKAQYRFIYRALSDFAARRLRRHNHSRIIYS